MSSRRSRAVLLGCAAFAVVATGLAPFLGEAIDFSSEEGRFIFFRLRLPRALLGLACGAGLAAAGVILQAILRNPLATPYTLGVASGAAFGVVGAVVLGIDAVLGLYAGRPLVGMAGAVLVITLTYRAARVRGHLPTHTLLLAGVALTYVFSALILAIQYSATPSDAARILRWLVGSLETGLDYVPPGIVGAAVVLGLGFLVPLGRAFNAMAGGEEAAMGVGVDVDGIVRRSYLAASLLVGIVVAFAGPIGFIGLLVPHTLRLLRLVDNRYLLPAAALAGGGFLALCDGVTNLLPQPLPVGVLTHLLGGPFFLLLLLREKKRL
ncbi:MAG: FecCD family ABC transporter permease [Planctomycetota bacterium]|jgi:iron complex transport system permease protein